MKAPRRVLAPVDFFVGSRAALDWALELAATFGAEVELLHVWQPPPFLMPDMLVTMPGREEAVAFDDYLGERARRELETYASRALGRHGEVPVSMRVECGVPWQVIVQAAASGGHDLIVMGTHGRRGLEHLMLGSVAEAVLRRAPCPVLVVPMGDEGRAEVGPKDGERPRVEGGG